MYNIKHKARQAHQKQIEEYFKAVDKYATITVSFEGRPGKEDDKLDTNCLIYLKVDGRGLGTLASFKNLVWLSKLLGTEEINIGDERQRDGCETCDHGAATEATIYCMNIQD